MPSLTFSSGMFTDVMFFLSKMCTWRDSGIKLRSLRFANADRRKERKRAVERVASIGEPFLRASWTPSILLISNLEPECCSTAVTQEHVLSGKSAQICHSTSVKAFQSARMDYV